MLSQNIQIAAVGSNLVEDVIGVAPLVEHSLNVIPWTCCLTELA